MSALLLTLISASTNEEIIEADVHDTSNMDTGMSIRDFIQSQICPIGIPNATISSVKSAGGCSFMPSLDSSIRFFMNAIPREVTKHMIATIVVVQIEDTDDNINDAVVNVKTEDGVVENEEEETSISTPGQEGAGIQNEEEEKSDTSVVPSLAPNIKTEDEVGLVTNDDQETISTSGQAGVGMQNKEDEKSDTSAVPCQAPVSSNNANGVDVYDGHETEIPAARAKSDAGAEMHESDRKDTIDLTQDDEDEVGTPSDTVVAAASHVERNPVSSLHELTLRCRGLDLTKTTDLCVLYQLWEEDYEPFRKIALLDLRKDTLTKMCKENCLSSFGNKDDLASRIVAVEKDHFICVHLMCDGDKKPKAKTDNNDDNTSLNEVGNPQEDFDFGSKRPAEESILPTEHTEELVDRLKTLIGVMADEEQMNGNRVFTWNIISTDQIKQIAAKVPTTTEELTGCGLPENIVTTYGKRLLKNVNEFIETNNLQNCFDDHPKKKSKSN